MHHIGKQEGKRKGGTGNIAHFDFTYGCVYRRRASAFSFFAVHFWAGYTMDFWNDIWDRVQAEAEEELRKEREVFQVLVDINNTWTLFTFSP
jgi:hypothetical protein